MSRDWGLPLVDDFDIPLFRGDRLDAGLTVAELARQAGVSPMVIYRWEWGTRAPSRRIWAAVLRVLQKAEDECPPDWIWRRYNPPFDLRHADDWQGPPLNWRPTDA